MYVQLQIVLWAFIHVVALFWRIKFPIHSRSFEIKKRIKYIHIAAVVLAFILPAVPLVVFALTGGYEIAAFPPRFCWPRSQDSFFYSINLPIIIALQIGAPLLLTIFWAVHKVCMWC